MSTFFRLEGNVYQGKLHCSWIRKNIIPLPYTNIQTCLVTLYTSGCQCTLVFSSQFDFFEACHLLLCVCIVVGLQWGYSSAFNYVLSMCWIMWKKSFFHVELSNISSTSSYRCIIFISLIFYTFLRCQFRCAVPHSLKLTPLVQLTDIT